ncbi:hypothetical protein JI721_16825 [Alicyclobacillus cycloheptanicus]|uniref:Isopenicillin-N N-acyltransferase-like protein n=2 Tax=Alicyclobacillus cycloheptanicus TaxID=1457 RepID=A0ABT9XGD2_9BACL|nr:C45 family peptidase [Alicyclobacillus cycloheptanicus]MDQ0189359.1 isopenicillin-N N-acyltransferase-like protein [Alicyclobacillus cycloheptanicus]WDM01288.1 hypothetical protein JI721_16825 [Alicyclobacillus cycloheptanicus]
MGVTYGKQMREMISKNLEDYLRRFRDVVGLTNAEVLSIGEAFRSLTYGYNAGIGEMLDGIGEGAGHPAAHIFALNARTEILYGARTRGEEGCTSIAALPEVTETRHMLLGQNWDWHPEQCDVTLLLATKDESGFTVLTLTEAGMVAKSGMNSAGLGICANLLVCSADGGLDGVPYHVLLRGVLESRSMADAIRAAVDPPRCSSGNFLIADGESEAVDIEACPNDFGYLLPDAGVLIHSNHFLSSLPVKDLKKAHSALTILRPSRARRLLNPHIASRTVSIQAIQDVFRDHYSYPNGICRHVDERDPENERVCSAFSTVMDLTDRKFLIAQGPPCEHEYESISLQDLFMANSQT